jgi:hypothetical protein
MLHVACTKHVQHATFCKKNATLSATNMQHISLKASARRVLKCNMASNATATNIKKLATCNIFYYPEMLHKNRPSIKFYRLHARFQGIFYQPINYFSHFSGYLVGAFSDIFLIKPKNKTLVLILLSCTASYD